MALLTDQFRIFTAERFRSALEGPDPTQSDLLAGADRDRLYVFIGRPQSWDNENAPPDPVDSFQEFSDDYSEILSTHHDSSDYMLTPMKPALSELYKSRS